MRAVVQHGFGGTEALGYGQVPDPVPGPGEVTVRVVACAVNHLDIQQRRARVVVNPSVPCWRCPACLRGDDNHCPDIRIVGANRNGGYAEYAGSD